jgi:hypothetical protein
MGSKDKEKKQERRSSPRVAFKVPARIYVGPDRTLFKGYIMNMSETGVFLMVEKGAQFTELQLEFQVSGDKCAAVGKVAYASDMGAYAGMGIELSAVNPTYTFFVRNLAEAKSTQIMALVDDIVRITIYGS